MRHPQSPAKVATGSALTQGSAPLSGEFRISCASYELSLFSLYVIYFAASLQQSQAKNTMQSHERKTCASHVLLLCLCKDFIIFGFCIRFVDKENVNAKYKKKTSVPFGVQNRMVFNIILIQKFHFCKTVVVSPFHFRSSLRDKPTHPKYLMILCTKFYIFTGCA